MKKKKKIFQNDKRHSSIFWKAFQISRKYFLCHVHFKQKMHQRRLKVELTVPPVSILAPDNSHLELASQNFEPHFRSSLDWLVYKKHLNTCSRWTILHLLAYLGIGFDFGSLFWDPGYLSPRRTLIWKGTGVLIENFEKNPKRKDAELWLAWLERFF